jgi:hypothetical protein
MDDYLLRNNLFNKDYRGKEPLFRREHHQKDMIISIEIHKVKDLFELVAFKSDLKGNYTQYCIPGETLELVLKKTKNLLGIDVGVDTQKMIT